MEYNKNLYKVVESIFNDYKHLLNKIQSNISLHFDEVKKINVQLKKHEQIVKKFISYQKIIHDAINDEKILNDSTIKDPEFVAIAKADLDSIKQQVPILEKEIKTLLLPIDPNNDKNIIVEMRPAAGGDESAIFVADLFDVYKRYFDKKHWKCYITDIAPESHGYSYIGFIVKGKNVYSRMKFESGVHRVQRVPTTESRGRIHTSTITVAVLPEMDKIDLKINPTDLRIDVYRASGAGGQHVNRTESAVRITHLPTGVVAASQSERSQIENRAMAMKMLTSKIWQKLDQERKLKEDSTRRNQVGSGERAEKIRTYNYPQNRITDHRINLTLNKLDMIMQSGDLDEIHDQLIANEQAKLMQKLSF